MENEQIDKLITDEAMEQLTIMQKLIARCVEDLETLRTKYGMQLNIEPSDLSDIHIMD